MTLSYLQTRKPLTFISTDALFSKEILKNHQNPFKIKVRKCKRSTQHSI